MTRPVQPSQRAVLHLQIGAVIHRVGFLWSDGRFEVVEQTPDLEAARAMFYAAEAVAACYPATQHQKAV